MTPRRLTKCVGHAGASALAPANTTASFDVALAHGVDMIEFDVRRVRGRLVLAHTHLPGCSRALPLEVALAHLAEPRFAGVELDVDLKHAGCEAETLDALERFGLRDHALLTSQRAAVLDRVRALDSTARVGISFGGRLARLSQRCGDWRSTLLRALDAGRFDAVMVQHRLVAPNLVRAVAERGAELYAWTVEDARTLARMRAAGLTGVVTGDPRLFAVAP